MLTTALQQNPDRSPLLYRSSPNKPSTNMAQRRQNRCGIAAVAATPPEAAARRRTATTAPLRRYRRPARSGGHCTRHLQCLCPCERPRPRGPLHEHPRGRTRCQSLGSRSMPPGRGATRPPRGTPSASAAREARGAEPVSAHAEPKMLNRVEFWTDTAGSACVGGAACAVRAVWDRAWECALEHRPVPPSGPGQRLSAECIRRYSASQKRQVRRARRAGLGAS